jgi:hypothetical protein
MYPSMDTGSVRTDIPVVLCEPEADGPRRGREIFQQKNTCDHMPERDFFVVRPRTCWEWVCTGIASRIFARQRITRTCFVFCKSTKPFYKKPNDPHYVF